MIIKFLFLFLFINYLSFCQCLEIDKPNCNLDVSKNIKFTKYLIEHPEKLRELISKDSSYLSDFYLSRPFESRVYQKDKFNNFYDEYLSFFNEYFSDGFILEINECHTSYLRSYPNGKCILHEIVIKSNINKKCSIGYDFIYNEKTNNFLIYSIFLYNLDWVYLE